MTLEEFKTLTEEEQSAYIKSNEDLNNRLLNLESERDSFKNENDTLKSENSNIKNELKKTKELNFTLARKVDNSADRKSAEEILNEMFPTTKRRRGKE